MSRTIWVRVPRSSDAALVGKEMLLKPGCNRSCRRHFTCVPEQVEETAEIVRLLGTGDLERCEAPADSGTEE